MHSSRVKDGMLFSASANAQKKKTVFTTKHLALCPEHAAALTCCTLKYSGQVYLSTPISNLVDLLNLRATWASSSLRCRATCAWGWGTASALVHAGDDGVADVLQLLQLVLVLLDLWERGMRGNFTGILEC